MGSRRFCVDGTNLLRTAYGYGGPEHRAQEESDARRLVEIFAAACEEAGDAVEVMIVFDGASRSAPGGPVNLSVRFSRERSADDVIMDQVRSRAWSGGGAVTVVTADGDLGRAAEADGGRWMRVAHGSSPESVARRMGSKGAK